jgi:chemotaxis signal transduction protein
LVATAGGRSLGFALPQVLAVVGKPAVCPVPRARPGVRGVVEHGQILYPALDVGGLYFGRPATGEFGVLVEQHGRASLVLVDEVRGMRAGFRAVSGAEPGWLEGERGERALFLRVDGT